MQKCTGHILLKGSDYQTSVFKCLQGVIISLNKYNRCNWVRFSSFQMKQSMLVGVLNFFPFYTS